MIPDVDHLDWIGEEKQETQEEEANFYKRDPKDCASHFILEKNGDVGFQFITY